MKKLNYIIKSFNRNIQLSTILRKSKVILPPALHFYHIAIEIPVSSSKLIQLFVAGIKTVLSYERCACFDSE